MMEGSALDHLFGERILFRDFALSDEDAVHSFCRDPEVTRFTDWGPNRPDDTRRFISAVVLQAKDPARSIFNLAAVQRESGRLIGSVALWVTDEVHHRGELGYVFHPDFWRQGYATEATRALLEFGFSRLGLQRIAGTCHPDNRGSARVMEKAGMRFEGCMRCHMLVRGRPRDSLLFAATKQDFTSHTQSQRQPR